MFNLISKELIIRGRIQRGIEESITQQEGRASVSVDEEKMNMSEKNHGKKEVRELLISRKDKLFTCLLPAT